MDTNKYKHVAFANKTIFTSENFKLITKIKREKTFYKLRTTMILAAFILGGAMLINIEGMRYVGLAVALIGMFIVPIFIWILPRRAEKKKFQAMLDSNAGNPTDMEYIFTEKCLYFTPTNGSTRHYEYADIRYAEKYGNIIIIGYQMFEPLFLDVNGFETGKEEDFLGWLARKRDPRYLTVQEIKDYLPNEKK